MSHRPVDSRVTRRCDKCGQIDSDPHHQVSIQQPDGSFLEASMHFDCCGCAVCLATIESSNGKKSLALAQHVIDGKAANAVAPLFEEV